MENKTQKVHARLLQHRLIALLTPASPEECLAAFTALDSLGISLEIALRSPAALPGIRQLLKTHPDALVLAGTVMTARQTEEVIAAGAAGVVCPDYFPEVVERCIAADVMCIPGGIADVGKQLAQKAALYGCGIEELQQRYPWQYIHKLFPAVTETVSFMGLAPAWKGPFKGLQMVYTGGVSLKNLAELAAHDPTGIFCGSALTKAMPDVAQMRTEAAKWVAILSAATASK